MKARVRKGKKGKVRIELFRRSGADEDDLIVLSHSLREIDGIRHAYVRDNRIFLKAAQVSEELLRQIKKIVFTFVPGVKSLKSKPPHKRPKTSRAALKRSVTLDKRRALPPSPRLSPATR